MAHPDAYAEFKRLQHRYWVLYVRLFGIVIGTAILGFTVKALGPSFQYFNVLTVCCGVAFAFTWFQCVATFFRALNWRCPDCQHRFAGIWAAIYLRDSLYSHRCRHCGSKPDFNMNLRMPEIQSATTDAEITVTLQPSEVALA